MEFCAGCSSICAGVVLIMAESTVAFEVLLHVPGSGQWPLPGTIDRFRPDPEVMEACRHWLQAHGVVAHPTGFSLACSATRVVFESLFGVKLFALKPMPGSPRWRMEGTLRIPEQLSAWVQNVTLPPPPEFIQRLPDSRG
jgi:hypothetical protein